MSAAQFDRHRLVLVPLTPIHIGGGEEARLRPEDYRLRDGHVERVAIRAVLSRLTADERQAWIDMMAKASIAAADSVVAQAILRLQDRAQAAEVLERIPISDRSTRALDLAGEGAGRRNQIDAFFRAGGRPTLPGSSLKGALRTAWAAEMARRHGAPTLPPMGVWAGMGRRDRAGTAACAMDALFALASGKRAQDTDPFRDVIVEDAPLPEGATRIDAIHGWKRGEPIGGKPAPFGFAKVGQMHREYLRSVAEGGMPPVITLTIGLRASAITAAAQHLDATRRPRCARTPDSLAALLRALEAHHAKLWQREVETKFFAGPAGDRLRSALGLFANLSRDGAAPQAALVRLGWASHAEAKSLAGLRRIERPQAKGDGRIAAEGSTRHVLNLCGHPLPFGWALLVRAEAWEARRPAAWLPPPAPRAALAAGPARSTAPADPRAQTALGQQLRYRKGQRVQVDDGVAELLEDVTEAARPTDEVQVRLDGDTEVIRVGEIKGPA